MRDEHESTVDRRHFLKLAGFSVAGAAIAGCERTPVERAIPFLIQPEEVVPGKATWYATTCSGCPAACGILVKHRDGRPIKVEGNPDHPVSKGGVCVVGQSALLGLYDSMRFAAPRLKGSEVTWEELDAFVSAEFAELRRKGGKVRFLTGTVVSPTQRASIASFLASFPDGGHVEWDPVSMSAILDAARTTYGERLLPRYRFDKASVIVSFDADFLGSWLSPVEFTKGYTAGRSLVGTADSYSRHIQFESRLTTTGAKADERYGLSPAEVRWCLSQVYDLVIRGSADGDSSDVHPGVRKTVRHLLASRGRSLVVCGQNDPESQVIVSRLNHLLGNTGSTVDLATVSHQHRSDDAAVASLVDELTRGEVSALFVSGVNPMFDLPDPGRVRELIARVPLVVSFAEREDETTLASHVVCAVPHPHESWVDAEPHEGVFAVAQPVLSALGATRSMIESLGAWTGRPSSSLQIVREHWRKAVYPSSGSAESFEAYWNRAVHDGYAVVSHHHTAPRIGAAGPWTQFDRPGTSVSLVLYAGVSLPAGRHSYNAWLMEVPDPITKIAWGNCAVLSQGLAERNGISSGDIVRLAIEGGASISLPAWIQPGHPDNVVAVPLGYGGVPTHRFVDAGAQWFERRPTVGVFGAVGVNAAPLLTLERGTVRYSHHAVTIQRTGERSDVACTQPYPSLAPPLLGPGQELERRELLQETTLDEFRADPASGRFRTHTPLSMWPEEHQYTGHHWGMVIDPNACTGCSACVVSCQAENNIPVVGRDEVMRNREMHWIRIDRYIDGDDNAPSVVFQPMLCQHCDNAPCETVCPVQATVHSSEGLNQQVYNRCVGTRYCANNCPYKIRRFNWFDYPHDDPTENMILNPDVVVRERGVMEKCSFCYQRIQEARIRAKADGVPLSDEMLRTACQQSCPADAIVFGDMNDPTSAVAGRMKDPRFFRVLEELEVRPSVGYMTIVHHSSSRKG